MTRYEKFYKNDDRFMMKALAYYLCEETDCDDCPALELCKKNNDMSCNELFKMWLQKEVEDA